MAQNARPTIPQQASETRRTLAAVPHGTSAAAMPRRGFVLYVGIDDADNSPLTSSADLAEVAEMLRDLARELLPSAETHAALSLSPRATGPDTVNAVRDRFDRLRLVTPDDTEA